MQKRYLEFKADDQSFKIAQMFRGILPPGRYRGFDFNPSSDLFLQLVHTQTGYKYPTRDDFEFTPLTGIWKTEQGIVVTEDAMITVEVQPNTSANPRIDIIVGSHQYRPDIVGGIGALYYVIEGTPAAEPTAPVRTDLKKETILGYLTMPAGATTLDANGVVYTPADIPEVGDNNLQEQFGDLFEQVVNISNAFTTIQNQWNLFQTNITNQVACAVPSFQMIDEMLQWKNACDPDWTDLGIPLIWRYGIAGGLFKVEQSGMQDFPTPGPVEKLLNFSNIIENEGNNWELNRQYIIPQTSDYKFLLENIVLELVDDTPPLVFPFLFSVGTLAGSTNARNMQVRVRIRIFKNHTQITSAVSNFAILNSGTIDTSRVLNVWQNGQMATPGDGNPNQNISHAITDAVGTLYTMAPVHLQFEAAMSDIIDVRATLEITTSVPSGSQIIDKAYENAYIAYKFKSMRLLTTA